MKYFYSHLVEIDTLFVELEKLDLDANEKKELGELIDANLHHTVLDAILDQLPEADKKDFMKHLSENNDQKIWELLNSKADNIEDKIKSAAKQVTKELEDDIKEAHKIKKEGK